MAMLFRRILQPTQQYNSYQIYPLYLDGHVLRPERGLLPFFQTGDETVGSDGNILCKNLNIPMCVDRAVYCTYPPDKDVAFKTNPSPVYKNPSGEQLLTLF